MSISLIFNLAHESIKNVTSNSQSLCTKQRPFQTFFVLSHWLNKATTAVINTRSLFPQIEFHYDACFSAHMKQKDKKNVEQKRINKKKIYKESITSCCDGWRNVNCLTLYYWLYWLPSSSSSLCSYFCLHRMAILSLKGALIVICIYSTMIFFSQNSLNPFGYWYHHEACYIYIYVGVFSVGDFSL